MGVASILGVAKYSGIWLTIMGVAYYCVSGFYFGSG